MKTISIFVDESGDFGKYEKFSHYYVITMVIHNQDFNISDKICHLDYELSLMGIPNHTVHTSPLIRREENYVNMQPNERRKIFSKLYYFAMNCDIQYKTFIFNKKEFTDTLKLEERMYRDMKLFFDESLSYFQSFENVILYYDNGQQKLNHLLNLVLAACFAKYEIRKILPSEYKLFQVADLICTLELLNKKFETKEMTRSEKLIFHTKRDFKKDFYKGLRKKNFSI